MENRHFSPGMNIVHWDGKDDNRNIVTDGPYIVSIKVNDELKTKVIMVVNR